MTGLPGPGHNRGPSMAQGRGWQRHCWRRARSQLLPVLPLQVVRLRVARAARLGLDYPTYARVRATTGRDIVAFLFSSNAVPAGHEAALRQVPHAARCVAVQPPDTPEALVMRWQNAGSRLDAAEAAPPFTASLAATAGRLRALLRGERLPADGTLLVAVTAVEREWCAAARLAGVIAPADMGVSLP